MIRRWLARRRTQRACPHPTEEQRMLWRTDVPPRKTYECGVCGKVRTL